MIKKPLKPRKDKKKVSNTVDDATLWDRVVASIEPLDPRHKNLLRAGGATGEVVTPPILLKKGKLSSPSKTYKSLIDQTISRPELPELNHGTSPGVDKSTANRLKKGRQPIEGRLDLHGMTQEQAHRALDSFIESSVRAGRRGVLIITGKGTRLDGSIGVLRQAVPRWLNLPPNRPRILAFSHATAKDGGEGALYVLLKRSR